MSVAEVSSILSALSERQSRLATAKDDREWCAIDASYDYIGMHKRLDAIRRADAAWKLQQAFDAARASGQPVAFSSYRG